MRQCPTDSEEKLWRALRGRALGVEFRRQVVIANRFIVDFLAPSVKLVVEVDGRAYHACRRGADACRDRKLGRLGYRVLRLDAEMVDHNLADAAVRIEAAVAARAW